MRVLLAFLFLLAPAGRARAQDRFERAGFLSGSGEGERVSFTLIPAQSGSPGMAWQNASVSREVLRRSSDVWSLLGRAGRLESSRPAVVAQTGLVVPAKLWDLQAGVAFSRRLGERRGWGFNAGLGSASDEPFRTIGETELRASAFREFPSRERDSWLLFLAYSNNRSFLNHVPFPGAAYVFGEPIPGLQATIGLPFLSVSYQPSKDWRASSSLFGPNNLSLEGARRLSSGTWAYARFERSPSQWLRADRAGRSDRLVFDRQEARAGVRGSAGKGMSMDLSAGRDFRRRFYESRDAGRSGVPKAELADAWSFSLRLSWRR